MAFIERDHTGCIVKVGPFKANLGCEESGSSVEWSELTSDQRDCYRGLGLAILPSILAGGATSPTLAMQAQECAELGYGAVAVNAADPPDADVFSLTATGDPVPAIARATKSRGGVLRLSNGTPATSGTISPMLYAVGAGALLLLLLRR